MNTEPEFTIFFCPSHSKHAPIFHGLGSTIVEQAHVETPRRAECFYEKAKNLSAKVVVNISEREATSEELQVCHEKELIDFVMNSYQSLQTFNPSGGKEVIPCVSAVGGIAQRCRNKPKLYHLQAGLFCTDYSTPIGEFTGIQASKSAALAIDGAKELLKNENNLVYSLCRPPGHHALKNAYGGYCYFNNAALAAEVLKEKGLVCILDIDYHHGNGTQDIFYLRNDILYISTHADPEVEFPYYSGAADEIGEEEGKGFNINYPLPFGTDYSTYKPVLLEIIQKIKDMGVKTLILSFGADTAKGDPICEFQLVKEDYYDIGKQIYSLNLPTLIIQEGGYSDDEILGPVAESLFLGLLNK